MNTFSLKSWQNINVNSIEENNVWDTIIKKT